MQNREAEPPRRRQPQNARLSPPSVTRTGRVSTPHAPRSRRARRRRSRRTSARDCRRRRRRRIDSGTRPRATGRRRENRERTGHGGGVRAVTHALQSVASRDERLARRGGGDGETVGDGGGERRRFTGDVARGGRERRASRRTRGTFRPRQGFPSRENTRRGGGGGAHGGGTRRGDSDRRRRHAAKATHPRVDSSDGHPRIHHRARGRPSRGGADVPRRHHRGDVVARLRRGRDVDVGGRGGSGSRARVRVFRRERRVRGVARGENGANELESVLASKNTRPTRDERDEATRARREADAAERRRRAEAAAALEEAVGCFSRAADVARRAWGTRSVRCAELEARADAAARALDAIRCEGGDVAYL